MDITARRKPFVKCHSEESRLVGTTKESGREKTRIIISDFTPTQAGSDVCSKIRN